MKTLFKKFYKQSFEHIILGFLKRADQYNFSMNGLYSIQLFTAVGYFAV